LAGINNIFNNKQANNLYEKQNGREFFSTGYPLIKEYDNYWIGSGTKKIFTKVLDSHPQSSKTPDSISYYDDENYYITDDVGDGKVINSKNDFLYKINSHGFRSQHFKTVDENKITILTGGCSHSFGEGVPEEVRWQSFLLKNLNDKNVEIFDVSSMGASCRLITRNVISFIRNYGKPDYIFLYLPDVARDFWYNEKSMSFENVNANTQWLIKSDETPEIYKKYTLSFDEYTATMSYVEHIWALEEICEFANIKLFWTTWVPGLFEIFSNYIKFKNFVAFDIKNMQDKNLNNLPYWEYANDKNHPGAKTLSWVGNEFVRFMTND